MADGQGYLKGILTGLIMGAVTALLLTPRRGTELRHDLAEGASKLKERGQELAEGVRAKSGELVTGASEQGENFRIEVIDAARDANAATALATDEVKDETHDVVESL